MANNGLTAIQIGNDVFPIDFSQHDHDDRYPIISGDVENSAVLKGGNNVAGLKGWYYKAVQIGNDSKVVYLYLTTEQQIPILVSTANAVENQEKNININISKGDICSIINGNRLIDCFEFRLNEISKYGRISFIYKGEGTNPLSIIQNVEELKLEDYSVFCISKPNCGIVELSKCNIALGNNTKSLAESSVSIGLRSTAVGITSYAEGQDTIAVGECSHAEGAFTKSNGIASHTEGFGTQTEGLSSHAEGYNTLASGSASHSEGSATKAIGLHSHAEGDTTEASGEQSHAEGKQTIAEGEHSHSEGYWTKAHGKSSHVEGQGLNNTTYSVASGDYSHSEGFYTRAFGTGSHTEGTYTIAYNKGEHAEGVYNKSTENVTLHSVGIGTSVNDRKNAHEITNDGKHYILGLGGYDGTNFDGSEDVTTVINNKLTKLSNITYAELKELRDNTELVPGQQYRITDYETKTAQSGTTSAKHPFDVIVTALDESTISENASAIRREDDYYFETENLEAWQLKYCLDNDTERFAWADNRTPEWLSQIVANYIVDQSGTQTYHLDKESYIYDYDIMPNPDTGEDTLVFYTGDPVYFEESGADYGDVYFYNGITTVDGVEYDSWRKYDVNGDYWAYAGGDGEGLFALTERVVHNGAFTWPDKTGVENGKGVIYNMIDEYGNECPYDFKNIKFYHDGLGTDVYTFTWIDESYNVMDASVFGNNGVLTCYGDIYGVHGNVIKPYIEIIYDEDSGDYLGTKQLLNNITFISDYEYEGAGNEGFYGCYSNSFGNDCYNNSFGNDCYNNSFGNDCYNNSFGNECNYNSLGNNCNYNKFGNNCYYNKFGNDCNYNSFGNNCYYNSFGNDCYYNSFGNDCYSNSFGNNCNYNSFGNECNSNSFGNECNSNSFGNECNSNSFGNECYENSFENGCTGNSFENGCSYNSFGMECKGNTFGNYCRYNSFRLSASETGTLLNYCQYNTFNDSCSYNVIWNDVQPISSNKLQNINIVRGVSGTSSAYNFINIVDKNAAYEIKVAKNSSGAIKIYCEADLIK